MFGHHNGLAVSGAANELAQPRLKRADANIH
jgi:hypothetical protein